MVVEGVGKRAKPPLGRFGFESHSRVAPTLILAVAGVTLSITACSSLRLGKRSR